ncbi:hypothetical protein BaRGS_00000460 [Batillaria attramentaria]|uniref:Uncharacterized protein n=1 Tax=Batillaria attramentaria TaxID=370345 RepID=A0ABD0MA26_9CAEN
MADMAVLIHSILWPRCNLRRVETRQSNIDITPQLMPQNVGVLNCLHIKAPPEGTIRPPLTPQTAGEKMLLFGRRVKWSFHNIHEPPMLGLLLANILASSDPWRSAMVICTPASRKAWLIPPETCNGQGSVSRFGIFTRITSQKSDLIVNPNVFIGGHVFFGWQKVTFGNVFIRRPDN